MSDLGNANWSETDASNNATPPNGWPEGMNPSDVNNAARANMGALKRLYDRQNLVLTTGGTSTAYTLTNAVAQAAYYAGERCSFIVNATCGAAPTLNIDSLGALQIRKFSGGSFINLVAGDIVANQPLEVYYNSGATTFDIITQQPQTVWQALGTSLPSGSSSVSFQSIPASINSLQVLFDLIPGTNNASIEMQFYNSGGTLDSGSSYFYSKGGILSSSSSVVVTSVGATTAIELLANISSAGNYACSGTVNILNIQGVKYTQCNIQADGLDADGNTQKGATGFGIRQVAGPITGIKLFPSTGTFSGRITLLGTSN